MNAIMAEMFGKSAGCSRGRGGSMHLFDARHALLRRQRHRRRRVAAGGRLRPGRQAAGPARVTACFFGEGAMAEGAFHESMNLAALWRLPVLFCCENNLYAMGTALGRSEAQTDLCAKAASYAVPTLKADGMDIVAVHEAMKLAAAHVRDGLGPFFLELQTYRFRAHSMFDPELYRDKAEVEEWKRAARCTPSRRG
jgi:pyruvate dehydrogenase E1 component alpha subunit